MKPNYPPGFLRAWKAYPHWEQRSVKKESYAVWEKLGLTPEAVMPWIEAGKRSHDWTKEGGKYVKGFQSWLRKMDFSEPPVAPRSAGDKAPTGGRVEAGRRLREALFEYIVSHGLQSEIPPRRAAAGGPLTGCVCVGHNGASAAPPFSRRGHVAQDPAWPPGLNGGMPLRSAANVHT